jgi:hypothetical protein
MGERGGGGRGAVTANPVTERQPDVAHRFQT